MLRQTSETLKGNERYEGFAIELIHQLSLMLGFNYTFVEQKDKIYGTLDRSTKKWNGMINELLNEVMFALDFVCVCRAVRDVHCTV